MKNKDLNDQELMNIMGGFSLPKSKTDIGMIQPLYGIKPIIFYPMYGIKPIDPIFTLKYGILPKY